MGFTLDHIIKKDIFDTTTIDATFTSDTVEIDRAEGGVSISVIFSNGNGLVNIDVSLLVSNDGVNFSEITDTIQTYTDNDGSILYDVLDTNATYLKVKITHTGGSIDARAIMTAQRRH